MLKTLFHKAVNGWVALGPRHIQMNGRPWGKKGLRMHFTAATKGLAVTLTAAGLYMGLGENYDFWSLFDVAGASLLAMYTWSHAYKQEQQLRGIFPGKSIFNFAIDRHGRDFQPEETPKLLTQTALLRLGARKSIYHTCGVIAASYAALTAYLLAHGETPQFSVTPIGGAMPLLAYYSSYFARCGLLLSGRYTFRGAPLSLTQSMRKVSPLLSARPSQLRA